MKRNSRRPRNRRQCCRCDALPFPHRRGSSYDMGRIVARCAAVPYDIGMAAGRDAGTRHMKAHGRAAWNVDDWNAAADTAARLAAL